MKISDLINKLESLKSKHGDNELRFTVQDFYTVYGVEMTTNLKCGETSNMPSDWQDIATNNSMKTSTIEFSLSLDSEDKKPKITFRK
jgi:hypothetical protein